MSNVLNRWVHFKVADVYFPDPARILQELHGQDLLQGRVIELSDARDGANEFLVVEVEGLQPVVVPRFCAKELM